MKFRASSESGKSEATHTAPDPSMPDRPIYPATIFFTYAANVAIAAVVGYAALAILGRAGDGGHLGARIALALLLLSLWPRAHRAAYHICRWPIVALVWAWVALELGVYVVLRVAIRLMELAVATPTHRALRREMERAEEYEEWLARGRELDASRGATAWQDDLRSTRYNWAFVQSLIAALRRARR